MIELICETCNKKFAVKPYRLKRKDGIVKNCSKVCYWESIKGKVSKSLQKARKDWFENNKEQHGKNMKARNLTGERNPFWSGDKVTYGQLHNWIRIKKGSAKK